eukprot:scaffold160298_cov27-Prasinocladus_malaysianus.AAC.2
MAPAKEHETYQSRVPNPVEVAVQGEWSAGEQLLKELAVTTEVHSFRPEVALLALASCFSVPQLPSASARQAGPVSPLVAMNVLTTV